MDPLIKAIADRADPATIVLLLVCFALMALLRHLDKRHREDLAKRDERHHAVLEKLTEAITSLRIAMAERRTSR